jgi:hypothetical protein
MSFQLDLSGSYLSSLRVSSISFISDTTNKQRVHISSSMVSNEICSSIFKLSVRDELVGRFWNGELKDELKK